MRSLAFAAFLLAVAIVRPVSPVWAAEASEETDAPAPVSFYKQIRPILQANCQGCHQPAKPKGSYVMTDFERLFTPGDSGEKPVASGNPDASFLVKQITPVDGHAEMPKGEDPLTEFQIGLIRTWIAQGAKDDTPANARERYDADHPPVYTRPPIITSLDYSPDGSLIAVAGFHEVLLHNADGSGLAGRLIGLSERIQSLRFSPNGELLAVAGGQPSRMGEIQVWDVRTRKLVVSVPVGYDTLYGVSWSPDSTLVAFGCPDNTVRAIEAKTGKQVLQQGSHNDWVLDTVFSTDGAHIVSVGRDMTAKLTEVATQRFIDNITSITPGALRGGIHAVARHPQKNEILVGGSDGIPQVFQMFRQAARKIGDNATLLRRFPEMEGRIFSVDYSPNGDRIVAGASLDARGAVHIYAAQFDSTIPTNILKAYEKTSGEYTAEERAAIEKFVTSEVKLLAAVPFTNSAVYAVSFSPDGTQVAAAGNDGAVRLIDASTGAILKTFSAAPLSEASAVAASSTPAEPSAVGSPDSDKAFDESLPKGAEVVRLEVQPAEIRLTSRNEHIQLIVTALLSTGDSADATRMVSYSVTDGVGAVSRRGLFTAHQARNGTITATLGSHSVQIPVQLEALKDRLDADFIQDINPLLSKLGCNAGTCHGAREGKNGFKLSLRGYDPVFDVRAFVDDLAARRVNLASPDDSLMLLKATAAVPHEGGQRMTVDSEQYAILRQWIADGAALNADSPRVTKIELYPKDPVVQDIGARQQMRIVATYSDGRTRDVTAQAFIESGNTDIAITDAAGLVTTLRRGEAPVLARYEGAYAATTVTVMGDRTGFVWQDQPAYNRIDELVAQKWKRMKILPSELCTDAEFIRRVYLDLTGLPPSADEVREFLANPRDTRSKRNALIERLIGSPAFVDYWANKWSDLLQVNRKFLGDEGARLFHDWIRKEIESNTPYDEFVRKILTASGSNRENPAASYYKVLREPTETMENTTHLFLATRFNCNKCHDHPFERWTQDQYYEMAAFFAQVGLKKDDVSGDRRIGGTAVEGAKPLFEIVFDKPEGEVTHDRTGKVTPPEFPYPANFKLDEPEDAITRREKLAAWMTSPDNRYFALSYVNRIWGYLMGVGLIEPLDDIRAGNPPSNPELLEHLTREFIESGFNSRHLIREICQSRTYQLSVATHEWNEDDKINYSHASARRLPAEVLLDSVYAVTGSTPSFPGAKPGTRAVQLIDTSVDLPSGFLANLGRPPRESACECERNNDIQLGSVMSLLSGPAVSGAVNDPKNAIAKLATTEPDDRKLINEIFLRILNRPARENEIDAALATMSDLEKEHLALIRELSEAEAAWALTRAEREKARTEAIAKAEEELAAYLVERAPKVVAARREREEKIAAAEQRVKDYEPSLPNHALDWERHLTKEQLETAWVPLDIKDLRSGGSARLEKLPDGSIRSTGGKGELLDYVVTSETAFRNIKGVKLEVLPDASLPSFGPGFKEGDFLLSEIVVESASKTNASQFARVKIVNARADIVAEGYDLKHAFDGRSEQGRGEGWSIGPAAGEPHWAAFAFEKPIDLPEGAVLRISLHHRFQAPYEIGRFRLWITASEDPAAEGLPKTISDIVRTPSFARTADQTAALLQHYRSQDAELRKRELQLDAARKPLPPDEKLKELEANLARASKPVLTDPALLQLRQDVELSAKQLANRRLTLAQDLSWALINTPAFLFNR